MINKKERKFIAKIEAIRDGVAYCSGNIVFCSGLDDVLSDERMDGIEMGLKFLEENGIKLGDEFELTTTVEVKKLDPKPVSPERVAEVKRQFEGRWTF